jgi:hypothetical protein
MILIRAFLIAAGLACLAALLMCAEIGFTLAGGPQIDPDKAGPERAAQTAGKQAPATADIQKVVQLVAADEVKLGAYCKLVVLDEQFQKVSEANCVGNLDVLAREAEE